MKSKISYIARRIILVITSIAHGIAIGISGLTYCSVSGGLSNDSCSDNIDLCSTSGVCYAYSSFMSFSITLLCGWPVNVTIICFFLVLSYLFFAAFVHKFVNIYGAIRIGLGIIGMSLGGWAYYIVTQSSCSNYDDSSKSRFSLVAGFFTISGLLGIILGVLFFAINNNSRRNIF